MHAAGLLDQIRESELATGWDGGQEPAEWRLSAVGRALADPPILIVDSTTGQIIGVRPAGDGRGTAMLRRALEASGLSTRAAAKRLQLDPATLRRWLRGGTPIATDDPIVARAMRLRS
jgi:hypothetical protein